ncbi:hypothetical protein [Leifsonia shinshuensis]
MKNRTIIIGSVVAAIVLGAAALGIAYVATSHHSAPTSSAAAVPPTAAAGSSSTPTPTASVNTADAKSFATSIAGLFCRPNIDQQVWFAALSPYFSADASSQFSTTDPANVPCSRITGPGQAVGDQQTSLQAAYQFSTDDKSVTVSINRNSANEPWQVVYVIVGD